MNVEVLAWVALLLWGSLLGVSRYRGRRRAS